MKDCGKRRELEHLISAPEPYKRVSVVRLEMVREAVSLYGMGSFNKPQVAAEAVYPLVEKADREMILAMSLDSQLVPIALEVIAVGAVDKCLLDMRTIFKHAILSNASYLICFHNHPSGKAVPSREDRLMTAKIKMGGELLDIRLVDHIILGSRGNFYSFCSEENLEGDAKEYYAIWS